MSGLAGLLLSFLLLYKYPVLFGIIFAAAVIVPFPTNTLLLAAGAFASQGYFNFFLSLTVAVIANMLGDSVGYYIARRYGKAALTLLHIRVPSYIERLEEYVRRHPGPTIFLSRFAGTTDSVANILAGFIDIPFGIFLWYDFLGNVVSTGGVLYIGYILGINWQSFTGLFDIAGWAVSALVVLLVLVIIIWHKNRTRKRHAAHSGYTSRHKP